ncbi:MAG: bifunctional phosphopantothenoylcysteine decarboxylase/phosphopantothenate--cysteine ligase CoaBC [Bacteroidetes bacterium]|nr:bifunctional phosphopantothenoylcysteine decarboxylase/phosphopantothenate--cysteine ligase CoaBC [Bacteroidota bacterium]MDA0903668.1 bifunctional phosphopantothenoylcysteine decarboxylase/phosphopantothenate--cysteine ligase CoaBC [Bacteroidota bacterium]MDA1242578.1 bifunctional phosphopantothenoylcysteine decarboxylase/phosphopantothenate--cysteine ligase CoaBC [Bacteroidota bacterium]
MPLTGRRIVLGITGSIAAYKSAVLARELRRRGAEVRVVMTPGATEFITPLTLATLVDHPVYSDFTENRDAGTWTNHVELGLWGDLILVAPATANTMAAMVQGQCDNLLLAVILSARCSVAVAPAMDLDMYTHASTQQNLDTLASRGVMVIDPTEGPLASGLVGRGRMAEPEDIADRVEQWFKNNLPWFGQKVIITAGPTHEPLDAVRFLGNRSSGKMGFALAEALANQGAEVHLVTGPVALPTPPRVAYRIDVETALDMDREVQARWPAMNLGIACAAVADFRPSETSSAKWHRGDMPQAIQLVENPDILWRMGQSKQAQQKLVGFALETGEGTSSALSKLERKNLDAIVLNTLADRGAGFAHDTNKVTVHERGGNCVRFELKSKRDLAIDLIALWTPKPNA